MIINTARTGIQIISETNDFSFWLTGSRFFGGWRWDSDWDFFAQDSPEIREFLTANGFVQEPSKKYPTSLAVYVHLLRGMRVHVQLEESVDVKIKAQKMLRPFLQVIPKSYHSSVWELAMGEANKEDE